MWQRRAKMFKFIQEAQSDEYLGFYIDDEMYCMNILKIQEIIYVPQISKVPNAALFIEGVINLRGKVIPTVDLRLKFNMAAVENTDETCIIVVQTHGIEMGIISVKKFDAAVLRYRWPQDVSQQRLSRRGVERASARRRVQGEAVQRGTKRRG